MDNLIPLRLPSRAPELILCPLCGDLIVPGKPEFPNGNAYRTLDELLLAEGMAYALAQEKAARRHLELGHPAAADWLCQEPVRRWG